MPNENPTHKKKSKLKYSAMATVVGRPPVITARLRQVNSRIRVRALDDIFIRCRLDLGLCDASASDIQTRTTSLWSIHSTVTIDRGRRDGRGRLDSRGAVA